jgi:D-lactate dehydrogenase (cytochrome)
MTSRAAIDDAIASLRDRFGERLSLAAAVREQHGKDFSYHQPFPPDAVVFAQSTDEVSAIVATCAHHRVPVIPYGTGTSLEGQVAAVKGGICIDVSGMKAIKTVHQEDMDAVVEPGVTRKELNAHLRDTGLFFSVDPGADASIGGMTSTRASGTNTVRYGTMRENVLALEVVLANGEVISTGTRARKSATGYDLTKLFVGAEGTLGIITEITVRLHPVPEAISAAICSFASLKGAVDTVIQTIQSAVPVARIELLDEVSVEATNAYSKLGLKVASTVFLEFHGSEASVREQAEAVQALAMENGGSDFSWSIRKEDRERLWKARHESAFATRMMRPGCGTWVTDACVPISRLTESILAARQDIDRSFLKGKIIGHVGDGNFHVAYLVMPDSPDELAEARRLTDRVVERAIAAGGTASGEHGVGYGKLAYMESEHGKAIGAMRAIKSALDPHNIMNPGKIVST